MKAKGSTLTSSSILIGLVAIFTISGVSVLGDKIQTFFFDAKNSISYDQQTPSPTIPDEVETALPQIYQSTTCNDLYNQGERTSGVYSLSRNNETFNGYCTFIGPEAGVFEGGWLAILNQYEWDALPWNSSVDPNRSESTYWESSFLYSRDQIPAHTEIMFGSARSNGFSNIDSIMAGVTGVRFETVLDALNSNEKGFDDSITATSFVDGNVVQFLIGHGTFMTGCKYGTLATLSPANTESVVSLGIRNNINDPHIIWQFDNGLDDIDRRDGCFDHYGSDGDIRGIDTRNGAYAAWVR